MTWLYLSFIDDNGDEPGVCAVEREKRLEIFFIKSQLNIWEKINLKDIQTKRMNRRKIRDDY